MKSKPAHCYSCKTEEKAILSTINKQNGYTYHICRPCRNERQRTWVFQRKNGENLLKEIESFSPSKNKE